MTYFLYPTMFVIILLMLMLNTMLILWTKAFCTICVSESPGYQATRTFVTFKESVPILLKHLLYQWQFEYVLNTIGLFLARTSAIFQVPNKISWVLYPYTAERRERGVYFPMHPDSRQCTSILSALAGKYWFCGVFFIWNLKDLPYSALACTEWALHHPKLS